MTELPEVKAYEVWVDEHPASYPSSILLQDKADAMRDALLAENERLRVCGNCGLYGLIGLGVDSDDRCRWMRFSCGDHCHFSPSRWQAREGE
jgi:hypothetical protein